MWLVFLRFGPFAQRRTAGSCWKGLSSSWRPHPASCAAPPAPCAPSPPAGCTSASHRGETAIFAHLRPDCSNPVKTHRKSGLPLLFSLRSNSLLLCSLGATFLLGIRPLLFILAVFWWPRQCCDDLSYRFFKSSEEELGKCDYIYLVFIFIIYINIYVLCYKTQYLPAKWEQTQNRSSSEASKPFGEVKEKMYCILQRRALTILLTRAMSSSSSFFLWMKWASIRDCSSDKSFSWRFLWMSCRRQTQ